MDSGKLVPGGGSGTELDTRRANPSQYPLLSGYPLASQDSSVGTYWRILAKRKWIVLISTVVVLALVAIATFRMTPQYEAVGRIAIGRENPDFLNFKDSSASSNITSEDWDYTIALATQVKVLESDALALDVIKKLQLDKDPRFSGTAVKAGPPAGPLTPVRMDPSREEILVNKFKSGLKVAIVPNTRLVEIRYFDTDPRVAADIVNTLANQYIEQNYKTKYESTMQASEWLRQQLADLRIKVEESQEKLVQYQRENDILGIDDKQNITTQKLDELNKQLTDAQADRIQKEAQFKQAQSGSPELANTGQTPLLDKLHAQEADLKTQIAQLSTQFGPSYPRVREVNNQLAQVQTAIQQESHKIGTKIQREYLTAVQRENMLHSALEQQKQEANRLNERAIQYSLLKRDLDSNRQLYEGLLQKLKEAGVSAGLKSSNIRVVDVARAPLAPSKPDVPKNLALALLFGLAGGIASAFALEALDNTVRTPEQVQVTVGLPSLGVIPLNQHLQAKQLQSKLASKAASSISEGKGRDFIEMIAHSRPKSEIAEAYRALRTSILLSSLGSPPKVLLVTSALPQEGKTTTSINTAIVLAQKGARVILIDADLRRPGIHSKMGMRQRAGLSSLLTGGDSFENVAIPSPQLPNLYVLPAGPTPPHPAELLSSSVMKEYLSKWRMQFDHVVIDTPPVLSVTDAVLLSADVDSVILVIRSGKTTKEALRRTRELLLQVNARVMGAVINAVDLESPDLHYYYYGSRYGGQYYDDRRSS